MLKRYFELFLVVGILFLIFHLIFYFFFIDKICDKYSNKGDLTNIIFKTSSCKDTLICDLAGIKIDNNDVIDWKCEKKKISIYELDFYKDKFKNIISK